MLQSVMGCGVCLLHHVHEATRIRTVEDATVRTLNGMRNGIRGVLEFAPCCPRRRTRLVLVVG